MLEVFRLGVGESFYKEIAKQALSKDLKLPTYHQFKAIGNTLWSTGIRPYKSPPKPPASAHSSAVSPPSKSSRLPSHLKVLFSSPIQVARVDTRNWTQEQRDLYRAKACFYCKEPGHFAKNCRHRNDVEPPASPTSSKDPGTALSKVTSGGKPGPNRSKPKPTATPAALQEATLSESEFRYDDQAKYLATVPTASSELASSDRISYLNKLSSTAPSLRLVPDYIRLEAVTCSPTDFTTPRSFQTDQQEAERLLWPLLVPLFPNLDLLCPSKLTTRVGSTYRPP